MDAIDANPPVASFYSVKWISYGGARRPIIMQNENGCCPLLALANVLLLRGKLVLEEGTEIVEATRLLNDLSVYLFEAQTNPNMVQNANWQQNAQDVLDCAFPKLQTGLNVNVRFDKPSTFECTPELLTFDMLNVRLFHGWLVDPQSEVTHSAVVGKGYNELVDFIIKNQPEEPQLAAEKPADAGDTAGASASSEEYAGAETAAASPPVEETVDKKVDGYVKAVAAREFLDESASQLTVYGLTQLIDTVSEQELCVFFRNNHFATLTKRDRKLYLLVTDTGYLDEPNVVWETLDNLEGNSTYVNSSFRTGGSAPQGDNQKLLDADHLLALQLQRQEEADGAQAQAQAQAQSQAQAAPKPSPQTPAVPSRVAIQPSAPNSPSRSSDLLDEQIARQLQEEFDREERDAAARRAAETNRAAVVPQNRAGNASSRASGSGRQNGPTEPASASASAADQNSNCIIL